MDADAQAAEVMQTIRTTGVLDADTEEKLGAALKDGVSRFLDSKPAK